MRDARATAESWG